MPRPLILLTNDDGIESPGLAAAALAFDTMGDLLIVAPCAQQSGMGRSMPMANNGRLFEKRVCCNGHCWPAFGAEASPAQAVQHGILELADRRPALVISGVNYGENVGIGVTISGTVGAALEAAAHGIPAIAISLQVDIEQHFTLDQSVDFSTAAYFARFFAERWLAAGLLPDTDVLKIDVPSHATPDATWRITRLERAPYFRPLLSRRNHLNDAARIGYEMVIPEKYDPDSDVAAILDGVVSVTPISLDLTSRIEPGYLKRQLDHQGRSTGAVS
jgi:5'-nucleotidase